MSQNIFTNEMIDQITAIVDRESRDIRYSFIVPSGMDLSKGARLVWEETVQNEEKYIDFAQDNEVIEDYLMRMDIDIEDIYEVNDDYEIEAYFFGESIPVSLNMFKRGLERAIFSDLGSAWVNCVRDAIEEVVGQDPLSSDFNMVFSVTK